jgi:Secretion system C-terminal sorting domain
MKIKNIYRLLVVALFLLTGLSTAYAQSFTITPDQNGAGAPIVSCSNDQLTLNYTGADPFVRYEVSFNGGATFVLFTGNGNPGNYGGTLGQLPIPDGIQFRAIFDPPGVGTEAAGPAQTVTIWAPVSNATITGPDMVCEDNANTNYNASALNDQSFKFTATDAPGADACGSGASVGAGVSNAANANFMNNGVVNWGNQFHGTVTLKASFEGCNAAGNWQEVTDPAAVMATKVVTVKQSITGSLTTVNPADGDGVACEGSCEKFIATNDCAFPDGAGNTFTWALQNPAHGTINQDGSGTAEVCFSDPYPKGTNPARIVASVFGCIDLAGGGNGAPGWNAPGETPVNVQQLPIVTSFYADPSSICKGGSTDLFVCFDEVNGSDRNGGTKWKIQIKATPAVGAPTTFWVTGITENCFDYPTGALNSTTTFELISVMNDWGLMCAAAKLPPPVKVEVVEKPEITSITASPSAKVCEGTSVKLTAITIGATLFTWEGPAGNTTSSSNMYTIPGLVSNSGTYKLSAQGDCPGIAMKSIVVTICAKPVAGTISSSDPDMIICSTVDPNPKLTLNGFSGHIVKWQKQNGCAGPWVDIPGTAGLTMITAVPPATAGTVCYRACVRNLCDVNNEICPDVYTASKTMTFDYPAVGGQVVLQSNMTSTSSSICATEVKNLKLKNHVGRIMSWQTSKANSPTWTDLPLTANQSILSVNGQTINTTTYFRVCICSPLGLCPVPYYTAYSSVFTMKKKATCTLNDPNENTPELNNTSITKTYPSPTRHRVTLEIQGAAEGAAQIELYDITGKVAHRESQNLVGGYNEISVDISHLSAGLYIVKFVDKANHQASIKINKM